MSKIQDALASARAGGNVSEDDLRAMLEFLNEQAVEMFRGTEDAHMTAVFADQMDNAQRNLDEALCEYKMDAKRREALERHHYTRVLHAH